MAMALHVGLGGAPDRPPPILARLAPPERLDRARAWGFALRMAQRLSGGTPAALLQVPLRCDAAGALVLAPAKSVGALIDGPIERRLARLGAALGQPVRIEFST
jgi:exopolyphosphatase / guanosine-5'-triphosphate,3'-diphosphate pyrophosphatase